ncbi:MAG: sigma 54-interacting transcriptional regulator [bacterium]
MQFANRICILRLVSDRVLVAWVGSADLRAVEDEAGAGQGPIAQALASGRFRRAVLLSNFPRESSESYVRWLRARTTATVELEHIPLTSPTEFAEIHNAAVQVVGSVLKSEPSQPALTFHLSPGTPAMAAIWIILAKTRFPAELLESSREKGVRIASVPFEMSADFVPNLRIHLEDRADRFGDGLPPEAPEFDHIVHRSAPMRRLVSMARRVATRSVPVLLQGESGTGKELLARAIHRASPRRERPFVAVNCGAIPSELVESELFGHEKGAFTGAIMSRMGYFEAANGGTLFLDEVGELPGPAQVKLLRVLQEGEVIRVGSTAATRTDVRVVAATNRDLAAGIADGRFREDLYYRLAVAVLHLPPLRKRTGDVGLLADHLLEVVNGENHDDHGFVPRRLSPGARTVLLSHAWPGNVRELYNTLRRAVLWSSSDTISPEDMRDAITPSGRPQGDGVLDRTVGDGFSLPELLDEVARHYLARAMREANGNKSHAARLVGLPSYQTLTNWLDRYGVGKDDPTAE